MPSRRTARLAALTVAAACSAASAVVVTNPAQADTVRVHDIQGTTRISPLAGRQVSDVAGIVTGVRTYGSSRGFWVQDPQADADPATSEGVCVFTGSTPKVAVGDSVTVSGTVTEFVPGGNSSGNQSLTEISRPTVTVVSGGNAVPAAIVNNLQSPDIVALEEIQDNNGATNDGTVAADQTVKKLVDAIAAAGGPAYEWRSIDPVNLADGGEPGGNIRQVFLFNPERVSFTDRAGGDAATAAGVTKVRGKARLTVSPGRVAPASDAWKNSCKPLVGEFSFRGKTVFVIANHFASKGGDQSLHAQHQPPTRTSETQRHLQATMVNTFVKDILAAQKNAAVVTLGDINDFEFSETTKLLEDDGTLWPAVRSLPRSERYSYVFQGNAQVLDQILISPSIRWSCGFSYDSVHVNSEFNDQISDHDPQVLRFRP